MRQLLLGLMLLLSTFHVYSAPPAKTSSNFVEGKHYEVISYTAKSKKPEVTEYFSFLCGHCYNFEKNYIPALKQALNQKKIAFSQSHVEFGGSEGAQLSRAYAIAYQLQVEEKIKPALFQEVQDKKNMNSLNTPDGIKKFFLNNGVKEKDYDAKATSFDVNTKVSKMRFSAETSRIKGVPAFVVNQKYLVKNENVKSYDELTQLILYLAQKK